MKIQNTDVSQILSDFISSHPNIGAGVGKIVDAYGERIRWNFNYDINPVRSVCAFLTYHVALFMKHVPYLNILSRKLSMLFTTHLAEDCNQKIDWGIEGFFFVRTDLFAKLHGFDSRFKRFHEGPDLFLQIRKLGFEAWFTNSIVAVDSNQSTHTSWYRRYHWWRSLGIYFWKNPSRLILYRHPRP